MLLCTIGSDDSIGTNSIVLMIYWNERMDSRLSISHFDRWCLFAFFELCIDFRGRPRRRHQQGRGWLFVFLVGRDNMLHMMLLVVLFGSWCRNRLPNSCRNFFSGALALVLMSALLSTTVAVAERCRKERCQQLGCNNSQRPISTLWVCENTVKAPSSRILIGH